MVREKLENQSLDPLAFIPGSTKIRCCSMTAGPVLQSRARMQIAPLRSASFRLIASSRFVLYSACLVLVKYRSCAAGSSTHLVPPSVLVSPSMSQTFKFPRQQIHKTDLGEGSPHESIHVEYINRVKGDNHSDILIMYVGPQNIINSTASHCAMPAKDEICCHIYLPSSR